MPLTTVIRDFRARRGWSQARLAAELRTSRGAVSRWETGTLLPGLQSLLWLEKLSDGELKARQLRPELFPPRRRRSIPGLRTPVTCQLGEDPGTYVVKRES